jgi:hypothetical protein
MYIIDPTGKLVGAEEYDEDGDRGDERNDPDDGGAHQRCIVSAVKCQEQQRACGERQLGKYIPDSADENGARDWRGAETPGARHRIGRPDPEGSAEWDRIGHCRSRKVEGERLHVCQTWQRSNEHRRVRQQIHNPKRAEQQDFAASQRSELCPNAGVPAAGKRWKCKRENARHHNEGEQNFFPANLWSWRTVAESSTDQSVRHGASSASAGPAGRARRYHSVPNAIPKMSSGSEAAIVNIRLDPSGLACCDWCA